MDQFQCSSRQGCNEQDRKQQRECKEWPRFLPQAWLLTGSIMRNTSDKGLVPPGIRGH